MAGLKAGAAPEPGPRRAKRDGVAKGRNEEEDGEAVAAAGGSARTFPGTDLGRCLRAAERRRQAPPSRSERIGGQWTE
jgi:hypothetical protein